MQLLTKDGRKQCVAVQVEFKAPVQHGDDVTANESYMILGRKDPRHDDWKGSFMEEGTQLSVPGWQFAGGLAETLSDNVLKRYSVGEKDGTWENLPIDMDNKERAQIAANGLKELEEELGVGQEIFESEPLLRDVMSHATYSYICPEPGTDKDVYQLRLNLGTLNQEQYEALTRAVCPADDMIQSIIVPSQVVLRNDGEHMKFSPSDGFAKTKPVLKGIAELDHWLAHHDDIFNSAEHPALIRQHSGERMDILRRMIKFFHENPELPGTFAIDTDTLAPDHAVGMELGNGAVARMIPDYTRKTVHLEGVALDPRGLTSEAGVAPVSIYNSSHGAAPSL